MSTRRMIPLFSALVAVGLMAGCASTQELAEVRQIAEEAKNEATQARRDAAAARSAADRAVQIAEESRNAATAAAANSAANREAADRAFMRGQPK